MTTVVPVRAPPRPVVADELSASPGRAGRQAGLSLQGGQSHLGSTSSTPAAVSPLQSVAVSPAYVATVGPRLTLQKAQDGSRITAVVLGLWLDQAQEPAKLAGAELGHGAADRRASGGSLPQIGGREHGAPVTFDAIVRGPDSRGRLLLSSPEGDLVASAESVGLIAGMRLRIRLEVPSPALEDPSIAQLAFDLRAGSSTKPHSRSWPVGRPSWSGEVEAGAPPQRVPQGSAPDAGRRSEIPFVTLTLPSDSAPQEVIEALAATLVRLVRARGLEVDRRLDDQVEGALTPHGEVEHAPVALELGERRVASWSGFIAPTPLAQSQEHMVLRIHGDADGSRGGGGKREQYLVFAIELSALGQIDLHLRWSVSGFTLQLLDKGSLPLQVRADVDDVLRRYHLPDGISNPAAEPNSAPGWHGPWPPRHGGIDEPT